MCMFCYRAFSRKHDLLRHTRVHTGIKPYRCSYCQKTFARSDARRRHLKSDPFCSKANQLQKIPQQKKEK
ncbi:hypothetical protein BD770DRAFT_325314 [Pilaira anomala]|nr:hypothetical protein BD770DRAFT_325314 [Pilaira anomala]